MPWVNLHTVVRKESSVAVEEDDRPTGSWNKSEIVEWLESKGVVLRGDEYKSELLDKVSEVT